MPDNWYFNMLNDDFYAGTQRAYEARAAVKGVAFGMPLVIDPNIPKDEVRFVQNGKLVGKVTNV